MSSILAHAPASSAQIELGDARPSPPPSTHTQSPQGPSPRSAYRVAMSDHTNGASPFSSQSVKPAGAAFTSTAEAKQLFHGGDGHSSVSEGTATAPQGGATDTRIEARTRLATLVKSNVSLESAPRRSPLLSSPQTSRPSPLLTSPSAPNSSRSVFGGNASVSNSGLARLGSVDGPSNAPFLNLTPPLKPQPPQPIVDTKTGGSHGAELSASVMSCRQLAIYQLNAKNTAGLTSSTAVDIAPRSPSFASQNDVTVMAVAGITAPMPPLLAQRKSSLGAGSIASSSASSATSSARQSFRRNVLSIQRYASGTNVSEGLGMSVASSMSTTLTSLSPRGQPTVDVNGASVTSRSARAHVGAGHGMSASGVGEGAASVTTLSGEGSLASRQPSGGSFSGTRRTFRRAAPPQELHPGVAGVGGSASMQPRERDTAAQANAGAAVHSRAHSTGSASHPDMRAFLRHQYMLLQQDATKHLENTTARARRTSEQIANDAQSPTGSSSRSPSQQQQHARSGDAGEAPLDPATFQHVRRCDCPRHSKNARVALEKKLEAARLLTLQRQRHYDKIIINGGHEQVDPSLKRSASLASALSKQQKKRQTLHRQHGSGATLTRSSSSLFNSIVITSVQNSHDDEIGGDKEEGSASAATTGDLPTRTDNHSLTDSPIAYGSMYGHGQTGSNDDDEDNEFAAFTKSNAGDDAGAPRMSEAEQAASWQRSSASSMYGHGGSGSGRLTNYCAAQDDARPRTTSSTHTRPASASGRPRRFSLDTMSLTVPQKSAATVATLHRSQSAGDGGGVSGADQGGFLIRKVTEFTVPLAKDSSSTNSSGSDGEEEEGSSFVRSPLRREPDCADPYGPPPMPASRRQSSNRSLNSAREGGEVNNYTVRGSKRAGDGAARRSVPGRGYGYGYGLDDASDDRESDDDHYFSFYSHRARIKRVRGGHANREKKPGCEDAANEDDDLDRTNDSRTDAMSLLSAVADATTRTGLTTPSTTGHAAGASLTSAGVVSPQSRRSTIPFADDTNSSSATLSSRTSRQSVQPPDAAPATGADTRVHGDGDGHARTSRTGEASVVRRPSSAASGTVLTDGDDDGKDSDPRACCHCCPCRRPENFHLLLRPRSNSASAVEVGLSRTASSVVASPFSPAPPSHHQLFSLIPVSDDALNAEAHGGVDAMKTGEVSIEMLAPLTGPASQDVSVSAALPDDASPRRAMGDARDKDQPAHGHAPLMKTPFGTDKANMSVNSSAPSGGSPPPYATQTAAASPYAGQRAAAHVLTRSGSSLPTPVPTNATKANYEDDVDDDEDDAPVLSIQSFRRSSSRNIKRLGSSGDASPC